MLNGIGIFSMDGKTSLRRESKRLVRKAFFLRLASVEDPRPVGDWIDVNAENTGTAEGTGSRWDELCIRKTEDFQKNSCLSFRIRGGGLLQVDGKPYYGIDPRHYVVKMPAGKHEITVFANSRGLFGNNTGTAGVLPIFKFRMNEKLSRIYAKTVAVADYALEENDMGAISDVKKMLNGFPPVPISTLSYEIYRPELEDEMTSDMYRMIGSIPHYDSSSGETDPVYLQKLEALLDGYLSRFGQKYSNLKILPAGHAHIDLAWLWPVTETKRKVVRSFSTVLNLLDSRKGFSFVQSMSWLYRFVDEYDKSENQSLMNRIREHVRAGDWIPVGGMMVESDCNLISGESFVRQILYGQMYLKEKFGKFTNVCWLPDTFGFGPQLPQLLADAGYDLFLTTKLSWNDTNRFPHDLFYWRGLDGRGLVAHSHMRTYTSEISPLDVSDAVYTNPETAATGTVPIIFGYGDGGGGPTPEMLDTMDAMDVTEPVFRREIGAFGRWVEKIAADREKLPQREGELYLEYHRGTYTTQGRIKKENRATEGALYVAEAMEALLPDPHDTGRKFRAEWEILLKNQFHDILPGSAIREVYDLAVPELERVRNSLLGRYGEMASENRDSLTVFNPHPWPVWTYVKIPEECSEGTEIVSEDGRIFPVVSRDGFFAARLPLSDGMGFYPFSIRNRESPGTMHSHAVSKPEELEVGGWRISMENHMISRILYEGAEVPVPEIRMHSDFPSMFDGWELEKQERLSGIRIMAEGATVTVRDGPSLTIVQEYRLSPGHMSVSWDFSEEDLCTMDFNVDWRGNNRVMKMYFETGNGDCTGEVAFGQVKREPDYQAQFEFPAHRFVTVKRRERQFTLFNREKYGYSFDGKFLGATLLKSPMYPDPTADRGENLFSFAFTIEPMEELELTRRASLYNVEPVVLQGTIEGKKGLRIENAALSSLKLAENGNGYILRLYNPAPEEREFKVTLPFGPGMVSQCNILEEPVENDLDVVVNGPELLGRMASFRVISLRIVPGLHR